MKIQDEDKGRKEQEMKSKWIVPSVLVLGLVLFFATGLNRYFSFEVLASDYSQIKAYVEANWLVSVLLFCGLYIVSVALSLPIASLLTLSGAVLLGWVAVLLILLSATIGASIVFVVARSVLPDLLRSWAGPFLDRLEDGFRQNGFFYLLALRLIPAAPFWAVNIIPAFTGMRLSVFALATFIGIAPGTTVYVWVGQGFDHILSRGEVPDLSLLADIRIIGPLVALGVLSLLPVLVNRIKAQRSSSSSQQSGSDG